MRKIFGIVALAGGLCGSAMAQADLTYAIASLEGYSRTEVVRLLLTSQYDSDLLLLSDDASIDNYNKATASSTSTEGTTVTTITDPKQVGQAAFYPDLAKSPTPGKEYTQIEVVNLNGMLVSDVVIGSVTNTLDKEKRYIEVTKEDMQDPIVLSTIPAIEMAALDNVNTYTYTTAKNFTVGTSKGKYFIITEDNSYRYFDSNRLGGDQKLVEELRKGKPITAQTFFYEAQDHGLIDEDVTLKEFLNMSVDEQRKLLVSDEE